MTTLPSDYDGLREELSRKPTKFPAHDGEMIVGRVEDVGVWHSQDYDDCTYVVIDDEQGSGLRIFYASATVPRERFEARPPRIGERLALLYVGAADKKGGGTYHDFRLKFLDRPYADAPPRADSGGEGSSEAQSDTAEQEADDDDIPY